MMARIDYPSHLVILSSLFPTPLLYTIFTTFMLFAKKVLLGSDIAVIVVAFSIIGAPLSHAMTFSFPGSSSNTAFSFVAPAVPQPMQYSFGSVIPHSFEQIIPPTVSARYIFGGTSQQPSTYSYSYGTRSTSGSSGSSYTYGSGSTSGSSGTSYTYGSGSSSSGSSYTYGTGSSSSGSSSSGSGYTYGSGSSSSGSSSSGSSSSSSSSSAEDNADGSADSLAVVKGTAGASVVNLMLDGQLVQGNNLPWYLQGQNPFSYSLIKGKPNGTTKKTVYSFKTSTNSFSLATCNAAVPTKPLNWSIQVDPNSVPQNLVMMSAPQVTGGQTCSAGATGSCKKPTQMCFYADAYSAPSTIALTSSAPSWTVNMCSVWYEDVFSFVYDPTTGSVTPTNYFPQGWAVLITGPGLTLPVVNQTMPITVGFDSLPSADASPRTRPGSFVMKYNGASGTIQGFPGTYILDGLSTNDSPTSTIHNQSCLGSDCVNTGISFVQPCDSPYATPSGVPFHARAIGVFYMNSQYASTVNRTEMLNVMKNTMASIMMARMR